MCVGVEPEGVDPESHWLSIQLSFRPHLRKNRFLSVCVAVSFVPPIPPHIQTRERESYNEVAAVLCALMSQLVCREI